MILFALIFVSTSFANAQSRVKLDDVKIDGELQKEGLSLSNRQHFQIENEVQVRSSFKDLVVEYLPVSYTPVKK